VSILRIAISGAGYKFQFKKSKLLKSLKERVNDPVNIKFSMLKLTAYSHVFFLLTFFRPYLSALICHSLPTQI